MNFSGKTKGMILAGILIALLVMGFFFFGKKEDNFFADKNTNAVNEQKANVTKVITTLNQLKSIHLKESLEIFSDPTFSSLEDISRTINKQPQGRENPFAPLPGASVSGSGSGAAAGGSLPGGSSVFYIP